VLLCATSPSENGTMVKQAIYCNISEQHSRNGRSVHSKNHIAVPKTAKCLTQCKLITM